MRTSTIKALTLIPMMALVAFSATGAQEEVSREPVPPLNTTSENQPQPSVNPDLGGKITKEFRADPLFEGATISIDLYKGLAIVHGGAANQQMLGLITRRLQDYPGVEVVYNYMSSPDTPPSQPASIAVTYDKFERITKVGSRGNAFVIAGNVRERLDADPRLAGLDIDVDSYQGLIILHANGATPAQATRAKEIARYTPGVDAVLSYINVDAPLGPTVVTREAPVFTRSVVPEPVPVRTDIEHNGCCR